MAQRLAETDRACAHEHRPLQPQQQHHRHDAHGNHLDDHDHHHDHDHDEHDHHHDHGHEHDHGRKHDHGHEKDHGHSHGIGGHHHHYTLDAHRPKQRRAFLFCIVLTLAMMVVEFAAGFWTGSLMLISDAIHMLSHAGALAISFVAIMLANRRTSDALPYGLYRIEILAAFVNGIALVGFTGWIFYESVIRLMRPTVIHTHEMSVVAVIGLLVNLTTAVVLHRSGVDDLNTKSAFFHMLADTFSSVAIVAGAIVINFTHWYILDPILSLVVGLMIARWSWGLLKESMMILLERKPDEIDLGALRDKLTNAIPEVKEVHDLHVWEITSQFVCMSAHLVIDDMTVKETEAIRSKAAHLLESDFGIAHAVLQMEC